MRRLTFIVVAVLVVVSTVPGIGSQAELTTLMRETFDDNDGGWKEQQTSWIRSGVEDGVFRITTSVNLQQTIVRNVGLPAEGDFDVECTVETRWGNPEWPFGLIWGYQNPANFLEYVIWMDGRFRITRNASLDTQLLVPETETADVHTGFATNHLKLSHAATGSSFTSTGRSRERSRLPAGSGPVSASSSGTRSRCCSTISS